MFSLAEVSMNSIPICEAKLVDPQSFTSLKTDLLRVLSYINGGFSISRCLKGTFPERNFTVKALVSLTQKRRFTIVYSSHLG